MLDGTHDTPRRGFHDDADQAVGRGHGRVGDTELAEFFRRAQGESRKAAVEVFGSVTGSDRSTWTG
ncbi:MAG: hypothetical protein ABIQ18_32095 [Umezawaea sp.]